MAVAIDARAGWIVRVVRRLVAGRRGSSRPTLDAWRGTDTRGVWCRAIVLAELRTRELGSSEA